MTNQRLREPALLAWVRMIRVVQQISRAGSEPTARFGLTAPQFSILLHLSNGEAITQQALAEQMGVTKGNISQLVAKLEGEGLITRAAHGAANHLGLTDEGKTMVRNILPDHHQFIRAAFASLNASEQEHLLTLLTKLDHGLRNLEGNTPLKSN